ncbi:nitroreductase family deazaflavin-dependent oxidoreductase [Rhodococcus opacus]|uniref:nitroreductase family deazaflavin-dependent oxidoreductase n=1 Tax=Rhodococcus opacus TaxID=37919 RepID=UPI00211E5BC4|nr:nitroreductase family deazaflavin-dependent oxidoreductase [Rhodococcus opacus]
MISEQTKARIQHDLDARFGRFGVWLYRATRGRIARPWRRRVLVLTTRGRRTGLARSILLQYFPDGTDRIVVAANSGRPTHPAWYHNLTATPEATVEVDGQTVTVRAVELTDAQAKHWWGPPGASRCSDSSPRADRRWRGSTAASSIPLSTAYPAGRESAEVPARKFVWQRMTSAVTPSTSAWIATCIPDLNVHS